MGESDPEKAQTTRALTWLLILCTAGYAWQLYTVWHGIAVLVLLPIVVAATNLVVIFLGGGLVSVRINKAVWIGGTFIGLALPNVEVLGSKLF